MSDWYRWDGADLVINIRAAPRSSRDEFGEVIDGRIRLRTTAPPVDGKANTHLIKFLAKLFRVPSGQVHLLSGETQRDKCFRITQPRQLPSSSDDSLVCWCATFEAAGIRRGYQRISKKYFLRGAHNRTLGQISDKF